MLNVTRPRVNNKSSLQDDWQGPDMPLDVSDTEAVSAFSTGLVHSVCREVLADMLHDSERVHCCRCFPTR